MAHVNRIENARRGPGMKTVLRIVEYYTAGAAIVPALLIAAAVEWAGSNRRQSLMRIRALEAEAAKSRRRAEHIKVTGEDVLADLDETTRDRRIALD